MILITGGTGLVGSHLLLSLLKKGESVRAIHRKNSNIQAVRDIFKIYSDQVDFLFDKIEWVEADITDIPALEEAFKGVSIVYHCAAYVNFNPSKYPVLKKVNIEGTANIVNLSLHFGIRKLCFVSSVATLSKKTDEQFMTEKSYWNPDEKNSVYGISKYGAEMEVWRGTQEGLNAVIVNPGVILGVAPDEDSSGIATKLGSRGFPFYPSGSIGIIDVRDVVNIMIELTDSSVVNERFILVNENISYRSLMTDLAHLSGKKAPAKKLSKTLMQIISSIDGVCHSIFRTRRKITKDIVRSMFKKSEYSNKKIVDLLDYDFIPTEDTLSFIVENTIKK